MADLSTKGSLPGRVDGRRPDELRPLRFHNHVAPYATGSTLIEWGQTRVICAVTVEEAVPRWMKEQNVQGGWITAEYSMLPYSTLQRKPREISRGKIDGRSQEIQRLIGRAMRAAVDLEKLGPRTLWVDCDVLQADGGTRTASITGAAVALHRALSSLKLPEHPMVALVGAISVGVVDGQPVLDLDYREDSAAAVDMNVVMDSRGRFVEVQGTGEESTFSREELERMLDMAVQGAASVIALQKETLGL